MKRSEMIQILEQAVYDFQHFDTIHGDKVLDVLESNGMLPPERQIPREFRELFGGQTVVIETSNTWEPELDKEES